MRVAQEGSTKSLPHCRIPEGRTLGLACVGEWKGRNSLADTCCMRGGGGGGGTSILRGGWRLCSGDASRHKLARAPVGGLAVLQLADSELGEGEQELLGFVAGDAKSGERFQVGAHVRAAVTNDDCVDGGRDLASRSARSLAALGLYHSSGLPAV